MYVEKRLLKLYDLRLELYVRRSYYTSVFYTASAVKSSYCLHAQKALLAYDIRVHILLELE